MLKNNVNLQIKKIKKQHKKTTKCYNKIGDTMEEKFQEAINALLIQANQDVLNDYTNLPPNIKHKLMIFGERNIEYFYEKYSSFLNKTNPNVLYVNYDSFMENNQFSMDKIEKNKKLLIETYIKKIVLENKKDILLNPSKTNDQEIQDFINRHGFQISNDLQKSIQEEKKTENKSDKEIIAENYEIDLNNINTLTISGHIYYKFIKDGKPKMIETLNENGLQSEIDQKKSKEENQNNLENSKMQVSIIPIYELPAHQKELDSLSIDQIEKLKAILKQKDKLQIAYINLSNGIAIKANGECVYAEKNEKGEYEVKDAEAKETTNIISNEQEENTNENTNETTNETTNENTNETTNETTNENTIENTKQKDKQKVLVLTNNRGASSILILTLVTSFVAGVILTILFTLMK